MLSRHQIEHRWLREVSGTSKPPHHLNKAKCGPVLHLLQQEEDTHLYLTNRSAPILGTLTELFCLMVLKKKLVWTCFFFFFHFYPGPRQGHRDLQADRTPWQPPQASSRVDFRVWVHPLKSRIKLWLPSNPWSSSHLAETSIHPEAPSHLQISQHTLGDLQLSVRAPSGRSNLVDLEGERGLRTLLVL